MKKERENPLQSPYIIIRERKNKTLLIFGISTLSTLIYSPPKDLARGTEVEGTTARQNVAPEHHISVTINVLQELKNRNVLQELKNRIFNLTHANRKGNLV